MFFMIANASVCRTYLINFATFLTLLLNLDCICSLASLLFYKDPVFRGYVFNLLRDLRIFFFLKMRFEEFD